MSTIVRRSCQLAGILLLVPAAPAAAQDGVTVTGWGPDRAFAAASPDSLAVDTVWVTPRGQPREAHVGAALSRRPRASGMAADDLEAATGRLVVPSAVRGPRWARYVIRIGVKAPAPVTADGRLVVLVRHAEKAAEPRADPPLTDAGRARAEALADVLASSDIGAIVVTPFERTRATAAPLARARGIAPIEVPVGRSMSEHVAAVAAAVRALPAGDAVLVVGHSNTIPHIITALGGPDLADLCDSQYSVLYVMTVPDAGPARLVTASYGVPDPPATGCPAMR